MKLMSHENKELSNINKQYYRLELNSNIFIQKNYIEWIGPLTIH